MPFVLLINEPRGQRASRSEAEGRALYQRMVEYGAGLKERGLLLAVESLKSDEEGVRLQKREGRDHLLDGPFSEAREMVGGFFLLACGSREEALAVAAECPATEWATVEVRETGPCFL
ncbi:dehydrogenase [Stagnimonas aquatica]|uniref:Dehydrogenase n=1 Tax=Stagnimonas aquatica TaxID=2689987 RepID=A0A3N0VFC6_9GAMM|nr:YciI family protein [Stagnimonas aquatica]ROH90988.1 dehydrogenase [Stagnimonas aquatica]